MENRNRIPRSTSLDYELPLTVESIRKGWISSVQASTFISGVFAVATTILLVFNRNSDKITAALRSSDKRILALEIISHSSLFLNISSCMSCFILIDRLGDVAFHASQKPESTKGGNVTLRQQNILTLYGIGALWRWVVWHWLFCFTFGAFSFFTQVVLYIWLEESKAIKIAMASLAGFCSLPFIAFILAPGVNLFIELSPLSRRTSISSDPRSPTTVSDVESTAARSPGSPTQRLPHHSLSQSRPPLTPIYEAMAKAKIPWAPEEKRLSIQSSV